MSEETRVFKVLVNGAGQYSLFPEALPTPGGWQDAGKVGAEADCVAYVDEVWTDITPGATGTADR
jgi:MbtH protein